MRKILITRPFDQAKETGTVFRDLEFDPIFSPVLKITSVLFDPLPKPIGAIVISSQNALYATKGIPKETIFFCVGQGIAERLKKRNFKTIYISPEGTLKGIYPLIFQKFLPKKGPLIYLRGHHVHENLRQILNKETLLIPVVERIVYEAKKVDSLTQEALLLLKEGKLPFVTFFSRRSVQQFVTIVENAGLIPCLNQVLAVCISVSVASVIEGGIWKDIWTASTPDLSGMLQVLKGNETIKKGNISDNRREQRERSA
ncbi:MAG: uroporphyrinogen-III synthase [bacterium]|nr:uroporphyrinogen-III synthase [bacterium]